MSLIPAGISGEQAYTLENSLRFRGSASAYLDWTPSSAGDRQTWTFSVWVKGGPWSSSTFQTLLATPSYSDKISFYADYIRWYLGNGAPYLVVTYGQYFRDPSAWYHFVFTLDTTNATAADRMRIYQNGVRLSGSGWSSTLPPQNYSSGNINNATEHKIGQSPSAQFDGHMTEINFIDGQALDASYFGLTDPVTGVWAPKKYTGTYGTNGFYLPTTATTQAEGFNTVLFTGTSQDNQTISDVGFQPDLVWLKSTSNSQNHYLIDSVRGGDKFLYPNAQNGENATGTLYRQFITEFTSDGFTVTDQIISNGYDYAAWTWDAGDNQTSTGISSVPYSGNGNQRKVSGFGFSPDFVWIKTRTNNGVGNTNHFLFDTVRGASKRLTSSTTAAEVTDTTELNSFDADGFSVGSDISVNSAGEEIVAWGWDAGDGDPVTNTQGTITSTVKANDSTGFSIATYTVPSVGSTSFSFGHGLSTAPSVVISKARNATTGWITYHSSVGTGKYLTLNTINAAATETNSYSAVSSTTVTGGTDTWWGVGEDYVSYCFSEVSGVSSFGSYTGTGSSGNAITGLGFRPGFLMIKRTDTANYEWVIVDSTRDPFNSANHILAANDSLPESSYGTTNRNIDFDSDGFTIQSTAAGGLNALNASGGTYIYMAFKGSYSDYVSPLNTDGDITSRVKANTAKGFSIVSYEGNGSNSTIGHGLSSAPEFFFLKNRDTGVNDWIVYHSDVGATKFLRLNQTNATTTQTNIFNDTEPTSSVFTVGTNSAVNTSGVNYIAYCWHSVSGYSDFGTYTGNGSTSGPTVTTGFRPAFVLVKSTTNGAQSWHLYDGTRNPSNPVDLRLNTNATAAEDAVITLGNFTDTGFEITSSATQVNQSGGTYIYMAFADTRDAQFNFDASGNKNNWTPNNINSNAPTEETYDIMTDVPTLTDSDAANYATINPLAKTPTAATYADGNLKVTTGAAGGDGFGTIAIPSSGKYYWEVIPQSGTGGPMIGISDYVANRTYAWSGTTNSVIYYSNGNKYVDGSGSAYGSSYSNGDVIGVAVDADAGDIEFFVNNVSQGSITHQVSGLFPVLSDGASALTVTYTINFGQQPFRYTPPTGFLPLNTYNLPDSTIKDGSKYMNTVTYTGDGTTSHAITGVGFEPDIVWIKSRSQTTNHGIHDSVRLTTGGAPKILYPSATNAESAGGRWVNSFDSDGFTVNNNTAGNNNGSTYVSWSWRGGDSTVVNTQGTISANVSANTTSGTSIVTATYTGAGSSQTFGHGLGTTPAMIITKDRETVGNYGIWHKSFGNTSGNTPIMIFNTNAVFASGNYMGTVSSTLSSVSSGLVVNGASFVQWIWTEVEGFSAFGSYTGTGSTNGPFIYTGFRPAWVMIRRTDATDNWNIQDSVRTPYNWSCNALFANLSNAESTAELESTYGRDYLSNGFKIRASHTSHNASGGNYIYAAFAENPFKNALAR